MSGVDARFLEATLMTERFYSEAILPQVEGTLQLIMATAPAMRAFLDDSF